MATLNANDPLVVQRFKYCEATLFARDCRPSSLVWWRRPTSHDWLAEDMVTSLRLTAGWDLEPHLVAPFLYSRDRHWLGFEICREGDSVLAGRVGEWRYLPIDRPDANPGPSPDAA